MWPAKLACPTPTFASNGSASVMERALLAKQKLHARIRVYALLENRSMSFSIRPELIEYHNANSFTVT